MDGLPLRRYDLQLAGNPIPARDDGAGGDLVMVHQVLELRFQRTVGPGRFFLTRLAHRDLVHDRIDPGFGLPAAGGSGDQPAAAEAVSIPTETAQHAGDIPPRRTTAPGR